MKKLRTNPKTAIFVGIASTVILAVIFGVVLSIYFVAKSSVGTQLQWANGSKEYFDSAYQIAAADKDTPDKTLSIPNLADCFGQDQQKVLEILGNEAYVVSSNTVNNNTEVVINFKNESASEDSVAPICNATFNKSGKLTKCSFTCNTSALGYGALSFTDIINNAHVVENALAEAGVSVAVGSVVVPADRSSYTTYESDGVTTVSEKYNFTGSAKANSRSCKWQALVNFDYSKANAKGNLAKTIRTIQITLES